ncbi:MAG: hypothetical protein ACD_63C00021G0004 [uncultured bacterium]|nr:MAG: hypothetical protein ACD_63C00021G0004 [uncultured bacterium]
MFNKLKQFKDMRAQAKELQSKLAGETVTGEAVQGMVKISMNGNQEIQEVHIDEKLLTPENKDQIENAVKEAFEKCSKELKSLMIQKVQAGEITL